MNRGAEPLGYARFRAPPHFLRHRGGVPKKTITVAQAIAVPGAVPVCVPADPATGSGLVTYGLLSAKRPPLLGMSLVLDMLGVWRFVACEGAIGEISAA